MKKILLVLILLISIKGFSQTGVQISKPFKVVDAPKKLYFNNGKSVLSVKIKGGFITLQVFDVEKMTEVARNEYKDIFKGGYIEDVIRFKDKFYFIYTLWDKPNETEQVFAREINPYKGVILDKQISLFKYKGRMAGKLTSSANVTLNIFNVWSSLEIDKLNLDNYSYDSTKFLIQFRIKPEEKRDKLSYDEIGYYVFNDKLELLSGNVVKMPYTEKKMDNIDYSIDATGNVYTLAAVFDDDTRKRKKKDGTPNFHTEILKLPFGKDKLKIIPIDLKDKFIDRIGMFESSTNDIICAGSYFNKIKSSFLKDDITAVNGVFVFKLNESGDVFDNKCFEFPIDIINQYEKKKTVRKNENKDDDEKSEFSELILKNLKIQDDGSFVLIGEQDYFRDYTTPTSNGGTKTHIKFFYEDILITKIGSDGNLAWMKKLPKRQVGDKGIGGLSYRYLKGEKDHYIIFLDNEKNINLPINKEPATHVDEAGGFVTAYKINDETGKVTKHSLYDLRNVKGMDLKQFSTRRVLQTSLSDFLIEFYKKDKEDVYIKTKLP
ncbi:MAG: hypothetical protein A2X12_08120 [Bacteroidetes bacterium GWE2_29_8]|nr:MAG: hypothetical protein A2X12_08120 [Bacteroidetes bacterium GWE2_29_8]OFY17511.1 MAG: hypothetical protein A2X02_05680 [Bacteroidetes bacterium GWF2_29_10]